MKIKGFVVTLFLVGMCYAMNIATVATDPNTGNVTIAPATAAEVTALYAVLQPYVKADINDLVEAKVNAMRKAQIQAEIARLHDELEALP